MQILLLSDIHGNLTALQAVLYKVLDNYDIQSCLLLGDVIDYGMRSNEVIGVLKTLPFPVIGNIWGNHEQAVCHGQFERFSSERGRACAAYTRSILTPDSWDYIERVMNAGGSLEFDCAGRKCLAVHGSLEDNYWKSIDISQSLTSYQKYDYVFSGHSHLPHFVEKYYPVDDACRRNKKKVIFINPGSVGQPRNLNPMAQYAVADLESETVILDKVPYDIVAEQKNYTGQVDEFYKTRLEMGI